MRSIRDPMRCNFALLCLAIAISFPGCAQWSEGLNVFRQPGEIQGRVKISAGSHSSPNKSRKAGSREKEILVFLEPMTSRFSLGSRPRVREVEIRTARGSSGIQLVSVDEPIRIHNLDSFRHELFTTNTDNPLRVRLAGKSESEVFHLANPGLVRLYCVLHPDENHTFVASVSSTYHAFVDSNMRFRIPDVPPGRYRVRAASALDWGQSETIEVVTAETVQLTLRLESGANR